MIALSAASIIEAKDQSVMKADEITFPKCRTDSSLVARSCNYSGHAGYCSSNAL